MLRASSYLLTCLCLSNLKLLFLKSYVSTDFDVHRNWMAITYNLPIINWYFDTTSEWTLDYPPLFAVFELFLAFIAHTLNLKKVALQLSESPIRTESVIVYQKITVIVSDFVYYYAVYKLCTTLQTSFSVPVDILSPSGGGVQSQSQPSASGNNNGGGQSKSENENETIANKKKKSVQVRVSSSPARKPIGQNLVDAIYQPDATSCMALLLLVQPGLLLIDHIHFQYNGMLSGVLLLSMANMIEGKYISASFWFAVLLNLKHIYLYCGPAYVMYLLASYCLERVNNQYRIWTFFSRAGRLGSVVLLVFTITYAPFCDRVTMGQILKRLFPFKRGLTHAYWAPNFWSLYNLADKILATVYKDSLKVTFDLESIRKNRTMIKSTSGRVGEFEHQYLPSVKPLTTLILVGLFLIPVVIKFLLRINKRSPRLFMKGLAISAFISFMFGWHVHEKAIILVLLPMIPIGFTDPHLRQAFLRLSLAGTYSLFPLIYEPAEYPVKLMLLVAYYTYARSHNLNVASSKRQQKLVEQSKHSAKFTRRLLRRCYRLLDNSYILILILNELYFSTIFGRLNYDWNPLAKLNRYEFLPLMTTSTLSALGISVSFLEIYYDFISCPGEFST